MLFAASEDIGPMPRVFYQTHEDVVQLVKERLIYSRGADPLAADALIRLEGHFRDHERWIAYHKSLPACSNEAIHKQKEKEHAKIIKRLKVKADKVRKILRGRESERIKIEIENREFNALIERITDEIQTIQTTNPQTNTAIMKQYRDDNNQMRVLMDDLKKRTEALFEEDNQISLIDEESQMTQVAEEHFEFLGDHGLQPRYEADLSGPVLKFR